MTTRSFSPTLMAALTVSLALACNSKNDGLVSGTGGNGADGGTADGATSGGTGATTGGTGATGGGAAGSGGTSGTGGTASSACATGSTQCNDGIDNDGDGKIDLDDPECVSSCDNDEGSFGTGIAGDNIDACKQDCFFDGNSGMGDDGCEWNLKCDPANPGAHATRACPYDPNYKNCPTQQSDQCIKSCQRVTPNGCDCFGCCAFNFNGQPLTVMLVGSCNADKLGDPAACPRCTQQTSCLNPCGKCEVCVGKPAPDPSCLLTPADGGSAIGATDGGNPGNPPGDSACPAGVTYCGPGGTACASGAVCLTGCCLIP
jgi:hypothetical protein